MKRPPRLDRLDDASPHARLLSNGAYTVLVSGAGGGFSSWRGAALTGWDADRTVDGLGFFVYLRDLEGGRVWSAGLQPTLAAADSYEATAAPGRVTIARRDGAIATRLEVAVDPERDVECRRLSVTNEGGAARTIEVTSYAEVVLFPLAAQWAHPAFAKLFVQTELAAEAGVVLASRRPRGADERRSWLAHAMAGAGALAAETDRARFVGRGRSLARPMALASRAPLSGTVGNVLDPILALRRTASLAPGATVVFVLALAAADDRDAALAAAASVDADAILRRAAARERALRRRHGLCAAAAVSLQDLAGAMLYGDPRLRPRAEPAAASALAYLRELGVARDALPELADGGRPARRARRYRPAESPGAAPAATEEPLVFENGYGGFSPGGDEYVIRIPPGGGRPPMPWINVVANERFGFLASESGAGTTWSENSRQNKLTPWSNDPVVDPHGEALYLRDEDERVFWSPQPGPAADGGAYEVRHGLGSSRWRHLSRGLEQEVLEFVPRADPLKVTRVTIRNSGARKRRLSIIRYARLVLGVMPQETAAAVETELDPASGILWARNRTREGFPDRVAFAAAALPPRARVSFGADRTAFLGRHGSPERPAAVAAARRLDGRTGAGLDPCAALQVAVAVAPGATVECSFLLGEAADAAAARALVEEYRREGAAERALEEARAFWREVTSAIRVETPSRAIDLMLNGWLLYQCLGCRIWGRSAFYQCGGAFGFRDQLQDSAALVYARPEITRAQILRGAAHQFVEGDVLHWWHPPEDAGTRTRCSDDLLWLPYVTAFYATTTGDWSVLEENAPFLAARALRPGEDETYLAPAPSGESGDVYEHCCRAIDRSLAGGAHGLPLIGSCDWNDGMNRVGRKGQGESVWLGFFLYAILGGFAPVCERRGDAERAVRYRARREELRAALNDGGWDGAWYRRAYYDDGAPLGSASSEECRIDALAQSWAVISGAAPPERARQAMDAAERELVSEREGLIRLLTPPFDRSREDPGYIKGYVPGIRENGGQYTHGALWVVRALAELGRRDRAVRLLEMLTPVHHARDRAAADAYAVEPYVVAADVYGASPHVGRGGWTWYTGSAGWMYRVALESILGLRLEEGARLRIAPCVPDEWPGFTVRYRLPRDGTRYEIRVENPTRRAEMVVAVEGAAATLRDGAAEVPLVRDGGVHRVVVTLGAAPAVPPRPPV